MNIKRTGAYYLHRLKRLQGNPAFLAGGSAIGVFIGLTPTIPFHTICILALAFLTRRSAIAGIIISFLVCNPLTFIPIYYCSYFIGNKFTPYSLDWSTIETTVGILQNSHGIQHQMSMIASLGHETISLMVIGGILFATPFALVSYFGFLRFFTKIRDRRIQASILN